MASRKGNKIGARLKGGKLAPLTLTEDQCMFCLSREDNEHKFGKKYTKKNVCIHYFCMLFASGLCQNGRTDYVGILGFLIPDILREVKRASRLKCCYCKKVNATIGCVRPNCRSCFHFGCGVDNGSLNQFFGNFSSFCRDHRPMQASLPALKKERGKKNAICIICMCTVESKPTPHTLYASCCKTKTMYHRDCLQRMAVASGIHFFKCPLCNNKEGFQKEMMDFGIYIPDQDAAWELEPGAYRELLERHSLCDSDPCLCPHGRNHNSVDTKWELVLCDWCGSQGCHVKCGRLGSPNDEWVCEECQEVQFNVNSPAPKKVKRRGRPPGTGVKRKRAQPALADTSTAGSPSRKRRCYSTSSVSNQELSPLYRGTKAASLGMPSDSSPSQSTSLNTLSYEESTVKRLSLRRTSKKGACRTQEGTVKKTPMPKKEKAHLPETQLSPVTSSTAKGKPQKLNMSGIDEKKPEKQEKITSYGNYTGSDKAKSGEAGPSKRGMTRPYQRKLRSVGQKNTLNNWLKASEHSNPVQPVDQCEPGLYLHLEHTPPTKSVSQRKMRLSWTRRKSLKDVGVSSFLKKEIVKDDPSKGILAKSEENAENILPVSSTSTKYGHRRSLPRSGKKKVTAGADNAIPTGPDRSSWLRNLFDSNDHQTPDSKFSALPSEKLSMSGVGMANTCSPSDHPRSNISVDSDNKQVISGKSEAPIKKRRGRPRKSVESEHASSDKRNSSEEMRRQSYETSSISIPLPKKGQGKPPNTIKNTTPKQNNITSAVSNTGLLSYQRFFEYLGFFGIAEPSEVFARLAMYQSYKEGDYKLPTEDHHTNLSIERVRVSDADSPVASLVSPNDLPEEWSTSPASSTTLSIDEDTMDGSRRSSLDTSGCKDSPFSGSFPKLAESTKITLFDRSLYGSDTESCSSSSTMTESFLQDGRCQFESRFKTRADTHKSVPTSTVTSEAQLKGLEYQFENANLSVPSVTLASPGEELTQKAPALNIPMLYSVPELNKPTNTDRDSCEKVGVTSEDVDHNNRDVPSVNKTSDMDTCSLERIGNGEDLPLQGSSVEDSTSFDPPNSKHITTLGLESVPTIVSEVEYLEQRNAQSDLNNPPIEEPESVRETTMEKEGANESYMNSGSASPSSPSMQGNGLSVENFSLDDNLARSNDAERKSTSMEGPISQSAELLENVTSEDRVSDALHNASHSPVNLVIDDNSRKQRMMYTGESRFHPLNETQVTSNGKENGPPAISLVGPEHEEVSVSSKEINIDGVQATLPVHKNGERSVKPQGDKSGELFEITQNPFIQQSLTSGRSEHTSTNTTEFAKVKDGATGAISSIREGNNDTAISHSSRDSDPDIMLIEKSPSATRDLVPQNQVMTSGFIDLTKDDDFPILPTSNTKGSPSPPPEPIPYAVCKKCGLCKKPKKQRKPSSLSNP